MKKRFAGLTVALLLLLSMAGCSKSPEEMAQEARSGVVRILAEDRDGKIRIGSAFGVGTPGEPTKWFVTDSYLLENGTAVWIVKEGAVWNGMIDESQLIPCDIVYEDPLSVAVLKAAEAPAGRVALPLHTGETDALMIGETVFALDYPSPAHELSPTAQGILLPAAIGDCAVTEGIISRRSIQSSLGGILTILHSAQHSGGSFGGPLIDEKGEVIGVNICRPDSDPGDTSSPAVDIRHVIRILDDLM